jgi:hypothetical protein
LAAGKRSDLSEPFSVNRHPALRQLGGTYAYALLYNTPWANQFKYFTAPPNLSLFTVNGKSVTMKLLNPEPFEVFCDNVKLR